jgi:hypothetical protein
MVLQTFLYHISDDTSLLEHLIYRISHSIIRPHDLAEMLGIDEYVAKIIIDAAYDINKKDIASISNSSKNNL